MSSATAPASAPDTTQHAAPPTALAEAEAALLATTGVPVERHDTIVRGVRLHYLTCGEGEPLLLIHGRGSAAALFSPLFATLAPHRRVLALDLPGWGLSEKPPFRGRTAHDALSVWMDGVVGFLDDQGLGSVDLLGHSMGGFTAIGLGLEHADRVRRLVLVDSGGLGTGVRLDQRLYYRIKPERLARLFGPRAVRRALNRDFGGEGGVSDVLFNFIYALVTQREILASGGRAFDHWVNLSGVHLTFARRLRELTMPTLLMWGDQDTTTLYADALLAARSLGPGHLVAFTGCGHSPFLERPEDFARTLLTWLDGERVSTRV